MERSCGRGIHFVRKKCLSCPNPMACMEITEDHAYKMLWDTWQYMLSLNMRVFSSPERKAEIMESAQWVYARWRSEVKKFQDLKRRQNEIPVLGD